MKINAILHKIGGKPDQVPRPAQTPPIYPSPRYNLPFIIEISFINQR
jgi:hypothetical protein